MALYRLVQLQVVLHVVALLMLQQADGVPLGTIAAQLQTQSQWRSQMKTQVATQSTCVGGKQHLLTYSTIGTSPDNFVDLDDQKWVAMLANVTCDIDHTRLVLTFKKRAIALEQAAAFHKDKLFIVGGAPWNCNAQSQLANGIILRRVISFFASEEFGTAITIRTAPANYDEIYDSASIKFSTNGSCAEYARPVCLRLNTDCGSMPPTAANSIPLYSNAHFGIACSNCFARLDADLFVEIEIKNSQLYSLKAGFLNTTLHAGMTVDATSHGQYGAAIDKDLDVVQSATLLHFKVGPVPFQLGFQIPVEMVADVDFTANADVTFGTAARVNLGDISVSWNPDDHWSHSHVEPVFSFAPVLHVTSGFTATAKLSLSPSFKMNFDRLFKFTSTFVPVMHADLTSQEETPGPIGGDGNGMCLSATYDLALRSSAELAINVPFAKIVKDWKWGPTTAFEKNGTAVPRMCKRLV